MQDQDNSQMSSGVSFPSVSQTPKKNNAAKTLLIAGILILVGILGFVIFKSASGGSDTITIEPTPSDSLTTPITDETPIASASPTGSPSATTKAVAKSAVAIEIQNGTGIPGEAAYLQTQLTSLGYSKISVGNAASQNATTTTVTFAKTLGADVVDEITKKLQAIYTEVSVKTSTTQTQDVVIVTGTRKGATTTTSKPTATKTPSASGTPNPSASKSPTPTPTKTPTATPAT